MNEKKIRTNPELSALCQEANRMIQEEDFSACEALISEAMMQHPHAPHPHNLMGILLEVQGDHLGAMKHFRAAWALDPTYMPCCVNLDRFGSFLYRGAYAYDEEDCPKTNPTPQKDTSHHCRYS